MTVGATVSTPIVFVALSDPAEPGAGRTKFKGALFGPVIDPPGLLVRERFPTVSSFDEASPCLTV